MFNRLFIIGTSLIIIVMENSFINRLTHHLKESNLSYFSHMRRAFTLSLLLLCGTVASLVHAIIPFLFESTGTEMVKRANEILEQTH